MKFNLIIFVCLAAVFLACRTSDKKREANRLAVQAMKTFSHNASNLDSINGALNLLDSAIRLLPAPNIYFGKFQIYKVKNDQLAALHICDTVLMLDGNNFIFTLGKGCTFETLGKLDSAFSYYRVALGMIDNRKSFNAAEITKEEERIVVTGLLKDTVAFNKLVTEFRGKYGGSKDKWVQLYLEGLDQFKRENYVN
jgi:hypothetical protein